MVLVFIFNFYKAMNQNNIKPYLNRRIIAALIDYTFVYISLFTIITKYGTPTDDGYELTGIYGFVPVLFWLIFIIGTEQVFGATIGNGITDIKPVTVNGNNKPNLLQSLKRHLLDPIDMFFFGVIGIITIKNTPKNQRLGDLWAKTYVVRNNN